MITKKELAIVICVLISLVIGLPLGYWVWNDPMWSHTSSNKYTAQEIMEKYKKPIDLDHALRKGEIKYHDLPVYIQGLMDRFNAKGPSPVPYP